MNKLEIKSQTYNELFEQINSNIKIDKYRVNQIFENLYKMKYNNFVKFSNIPIVIREFLEKKYFITNPKLTICNVFQDKLTTKYLFELHDGLFIESVLMKYKYGYSLCLSTQVGCKMACKFCMSSDNNFKRNLSSGEMIDQIIYISKDKNIKISKLVLMGIGEPLDNLNNVVKFIEIISNKYGMNFSSRNITISTSGLSDEIYKLANLKMKLTLSISLHSCNNKIRNELMPINLKNSISSIINACKYYFDKTKKRITFEYILIKGINDSKDNAIDLIKIIKNIHIPIHVNLIKLNENKLSNKNKLYSSDNLFDFFDILNKNSINVTIRRILGKKNYAACGQLKSSFENKINDYEIK